MVEKFYANHLKKDLTLWQIIEKDKTYFNKWANYPGIIFLHGNPFIRCSCSINSLAFVQMLVFILEEKAIRRKMQETWKYLFSCKNCKRIMILLCLLLFEINNTFVSRNAFEYFSVLHKLSLTAENPISSFLKMKFVNTGN